MSKFRILGLFGDFDQAFKTVADIRDSKVPGITVDDVTVLSPIEHPEIEEILGWRPAPIPYFTFFGACFGIVFGFLFLASAQATFTVQPQGGKPVVPIPTNIVINYEIMILLAVICTIGSFLVFARLLRKKKSGYSEHVSLDKVGLEFEVDESHLDDLKGLFNEHKAVEIREEAIR